MDQRERKYILENIEKKSIQEIARDLNIRERKIRKFLDKRKAQGPAGAAAKKNKPVTPAASKAIILALILIAVLGFAVYLNSINGKYVWDDAYLIKDNLFIRDWNHIKEIFTQDIAAGGKVHSNFYRPVQIFSYCVDYFLWKANVVGYHLTNIILHIMVALGIYWLINILFKDRILSLFASALFVVHPVHIEAVSYMSGRADTLAGVFLLFSLILYIRNIDNKDPKAYFLILISYVCAVLSRESSLILPILLLLYHYAFRVKIKAERLLPIAGIAVAYILVRVTALSSLLPEASAITTTFFQRVPGFFSALTDYFRLIFLPFGLHMEYGNKLFSLADPKALSGLAILAALVTCAVKKKGKNPLVFFSVSWFILTLLPQSNLYPINAYMAEHWLYLPSIGLFILIARGMCILYSKKGLRIVSILLFVSLTAFYSFLTIRQNISWREPFDFYTRTLQFNPDSPRAHNSLGIIYEERGEYDKAIKSYKKAIKDNPFFIYAYHNLGKVYAHIDKYEEAIMWYKKGLGISPDFILTHYNLGNAYSDIGRTEEAVASYKKAIELFPEHSEAYFNMGNTFKSMERYDEAIAAYGMSLRFDPNNSGAYNNLGNVYAASGRKEEAIGAYQKGIAVDPGRPDSYNNLAALYSYSGDDENAVKYFKKAIEVDPGYTLTYNNLAVFYIERKEYALAAEYCDKAVSLGGTDPAIVNALKPYREEGN